MKIYALLFIFLLCSCKSTQPSVNGDQFERILQVLKSKDPNHVRSAFGTPDAIESADLGFETLLYSSKRDLMPMKVFIDREKNKVFSIAMNYWVDFDAYAFLQRRFKEFQWVEDPVKSTAVDVVEERFKVRIPELQITFEYNNQDPLRRPMWIYFK